MTEIRQMYNEIMAYLIQTGFGGYVDKIDHNYKNGLLGDTSSNKNEAPQHTAKKNEENPASLYLPGGASSQKVIL